MPRDGLTLSSGPDEKEIEPGSLLGKALLTPNFLTYKKPDPNPFSLHSPKSTFSGINQGAGALVPPRESQITH